MNRVQTKPRYEAHSATEMALQELQDRIEASQLESSYAGMVCDLCVGDVPLETAFHEIHQKAMEQMVGLLDAKILEDESALNACLEKIAEESERIAWKALEQGTDAIREGLAILESGKFPQDSGYVN